MVFEEKMKKVKRSLNVTSNNIGGPIRAQCQQCQEKTFPSISPVKNCEWSWYIPNELIGLALPRVSLPRITKRSAQLVTDIPHVPDVDDRFELHSDTLPLLLKYMWGSVIWVWTG